ncbi:uncharacterized protein TM35_000072510 [Trypanosoma theileri]|uniref:Uncharacterized protein n=1 Tax=Trypanosoma theileri TaxID=67003 RepID=A0A1X0P1L9_9TRYP|nr:uncharacterized protein TM35_000072510 [Trypanosoma theileri]ORC90827.1 hypothetical protein TM35_000072510 [Trypanosoma theileri]
MDRITCRFEVQGRISNMAHSDITNDCLVSTMMNGTHIFKKDDSNYEPSTRSSIHLESFPHHIIGGDPVISSCFLSADSCIAIGTGMGSIAVISRHSRTVVRCYTFQEETPVLSLKEVPQEPSLLLSSSPSSAEVIDIERAAVRLSFLTPKPRVIGAVAVNNNTFAVANYDGKVMLYDARRGREPVTILAVPDQITSISASLDSAAVAAGTVGGRVFVMRCSTSNVREEAFGTGKVRVPIRSVSMYHGRIAAGDVSGKLTIIDTGEHPQPTKYWTAQSLLPQHATTNSTISYTVASLVQCKKEVWTAVTPSEGALSHVVVLSA